MCYLLSDVAKTGEKNEDFKKEKKVYNEMHQRATF